MAKKKQVSHTAQAGADHTEQLTRLKRIRGQIEGVERMVTDGRYCVDIINQMRSIAAALKGVEGLVLETHVRHCVRDAIEARSERQSEEKITELLTLINRRQ